MRGHADAVDGSPVSANAAPSANADGAKLAAQIAQLGSRAGGLPGHHRGRDAGPGQARRAGCHHRRVARIRDALEARARLAAAQARAAGSAVKVSTTDPGSRGAARQERRLAVRLQPAAERRP